MKMGIICLDHAGTITDIIDTKGCLKEREKVEFYNGILIPGLINVCKQNHVSSGSLLDKTVDKYINTETPTDTQLYVFEKIKDICQTVPNISLEQLLYRVTWDAAKTLGLDKMQGSFEKGKKPGVSLISPVNYDPLFLTELSKIKILIDRFPAR
jgi:hypothetical protein